MAKLKLNILVDGVRCSSIEDVVENFNALDLLEYLENGYLEKWLKSRNYNDILEKLPQLKNNDTYGKLLGLSHIFGVEIDEDTLKEEAVIYEIQNSIDKGEDPYKRAKDIFKNMNIKLVNNKNKYSFKRIILNDYKVEEYSDFDVEEVKIETPFKINKIAIFLGWFFYDEFRDEYEEKTPNNFYFENKFVLNLYEYRDSFNYMKLNYNKSDIVFLDLNNNIKKSDFIAVNCSIKEIVEVPREEVAIPDFVIDKLIAEVFLVFKGNYNV